MHETPPGQIYPQNPPQLVRASMVVVGIVMAVLIGTAAAHHASDRQVIRSDDLKQTVKELESYSAEATVLIHNDWHQRTTSSYSSAYIDTLQQSADSLSHDLQTHTIDPRIQPQTADVLQQSTAFSQALQQYSQAGGTPDYRQALSVLSGVSQQLQQTEETL